MAQEGKGKIRKMKTKMPVKNADPVEEEDDDKEEQNTNDKKQHSTINKKEEPYNTPTIEEHRENKHARCAGCDKRCVIY
jgi:hypothetical protein